MAAYADRIIRILEPAIGKAMATSAVEVVCRKQGINIGDIQPEAIESIADGLFEPLRVFAGDEFARKMIRDIKNIE